MAHEASAAIDCFFFVPQTPQPLHEFEKSKIISWIRFDPAPQLVDLFMIFFRICFVFQCPNDPFRMLYPKETMIPLESLSRQLTKKVKETQFCFGKNMISSTSLPFARLKSGSSRAGSATMMQSRLRAARDVLYSLSVI